MLSADNPTEGWFRVYYQFPGIMRATDIQFKLTGQKFEWDFFHLSGGYKAHRYRLFDTYEDALAHAAQEIEDDYAEALQKAEQMVKEATEKRESLKALLNKATLDTHNA